MSGRLASLLFSIFVVGAMAGGCAGTPAADGENDPYESFNRKMFAINDALDRHVAEPAARAYTDVLPQPARDGIHNVLANLDEPATLANDILEGDAPHTAQTLGRIVFNSTIGLGGLVDIATPMGLPEHQRDFGETLATYGTAEGPYLVVPLVGPSNPRDLVGGLVDIAFDPLTYIGMREKSLWTSGRQTLEVVDTRAQNLNVMDELRRSSVDLYATLRSLYRQHRQAEIRGGKPDLENLPNI